MAMEARGGKGILSLRGHKASMASRKHVSLHRHRTRPSGGAARRRVAIEGRCSIGGRDAQEVLVTDLGATGCRMRATAIGVIKSEPLELWLGDVGPLAGQLKWAKAGALGVAFDPPLESDVLERLYETCQLSNVIPLRK